MKEFIKKNFAIILAFLLPVGLIATVALSIYLPSFYLSTNYNFVYTSCGDNTYRYNYYNCDNYLQKRYSVVDGRLVINVVDPTLDSNYNKIPDINENYTARIFLHDTVKNESREITLDEAQALSLSGLLTSPDGVTVSGNYSYNGGGDFFLFGGGHSSYGYYLTKGKSKNKINLINNTDQYYYQNNFEFVGWVLPGRN
ncbi:MAG: hypothetical protein Q8L47_01130 [bacterium]|nr:hypothetical protein [bacterium]